ncbi:MAG: hypothetical protein A2747_00320 [Candidatus Yonathbacteria bacterium RIFCSPHIGHO2_01_FULL_44_41]|uniref:Fibronectin type-III domain-containing protein n=1 Tax=Candidatus Yonathbacteria bacterium RIFCSPHIGHO2_02_FULL_44_14 TaxID=1802724 RepID=A0A1G2SB86_9BACT|nr:MAG: hypothetical protein A2747_00320 [Candidatus Yonathbacteria bacterium RIFCSPHIGHO2_01_FULL_44_41]OHA81552.1 MAG: hypothetical protein A3B06_02070 [Candidatus Yonathbacteria bacterium RIFCSPLOWO2_01_FULL_43_20]OHA81949.1 MAG: hypothetical protein A3D51_03670 [Candidatus Yonathbacteria bacterium RIFCSPHIGHO2_02_FULL_44_14]
MNKKIKLFSVGIIVIAGLFVGASFASAQTATVASCNSATVSATLNDTGGATTSVWFEWGTSYTTVDTGSGSRTATQSFSTAPQNFSQLITGLNPSTTYYYRAVFENTYGKSQGGTLSFVTPQCATQNNQTYTQPYVTTNSASSVSQNSATLNGYVTSSGTNINAWFEWGTSYSLGNTTSVLNYGTGATSFNNSVYNLNPNTTYYYRAVAQSTYGTVYGSTLSFTTSGQGYNYSMTGSAPTVTTLLATELTDTTAKLNGLVFASTNQSSSAWFEWGINSNLVNKTQAVNVGSLPTVKHSDFITGLVQGQTYYYRIVAENPYGKVYGTVNTFVLETSTYVVTPTVTTPVVLKPTTTVVVRGSSTQSLVALSIEGGAEMIGAGEKRTYHVVWKNESTQSLKNVVLRVTFPQSINIDSATKGTFSSADNSVIVDLKTLASKESGETFIFATAGRGLKPGELLVVTANMVYTGANGVQGDAIAYVTHRGEATQIAVSANIFGAGDFIPTTLFEWLILMVLVLILVLLGNHLYGRFAEHK